MASEKYAVGVDLGGTSIKIGLVTEKGRIIRKDNLDTNAEKGPAAVVNQIKLGIEKILEKNDKKIRGIGIGTPGSVILKKGTVEHPPNFPGWSKVPLGKLIKKEFNMKVRVENDANAAAIGELIFGAGIKMQNFIMITLGTGVGGGIIIDRKIYRGETGAAGEIGHVSVDLNGPECKCGSFGCIEAYAGKNYLIERVIAELKNKRDSKINRLINNDLNLLTPKIIGQAAAMGDKFAKSVIIILGEILGSGLASVINVLDISNIIVGGGISGLGKSLITAIQDSARSRVMIPHKKRVKVIPAKLKNEAGIKGASALVFYRS